MNLGAYGSIDQNGAYPALVEALKDPEVEVRVAAMSAFANNGLRPPVEAMISASRDPDVRVRTYAVKWLAQIEENGSDLQPASGSPCSAPASTRET
jgi:HEAT repeat protein